LNRQHLNAWTISAGVAALLVVVVTTVLLVSNPSRQSAGHPEVTLSEVGQSILRDSRLATPSKFGTPTQAIATLDEHEAKLAILGSTDDLKTAGVRALFWTLTPEDVQQQAPELIRTLHQLEALFKDLIATEQPVTAALDEAEQKRATALLGIASLIVMAEDPQYDSVMPLLDKVAGQVVLDQTSSKALFEQGALLLYELRLRSWLTPNGEAAIQTALERNPNLRIHLPNWHRMRQEDFRARAGE